MPQGMIDDIRWILGVTFVVWALLGTAFGLHQGVKIGFVLYGMAVVIALAIAGLFGLVVLLFGSPFGFIGSLAGVWVGSLLHPGARRIVASIRRRRSTTP